MSAHQRYLTFAELREAEANNNAYNSDTEAGSDDEGPEGGRKLSEKTCARCFIVTAIRASVIALLFATVALVAISSSQAYPEATLSKLANPYLSLATSTLGRLSSADSSNGASSVSTGTTDSKQMMGTDVGSDEEDGNDWLETVGITTDTTVDTDTSVTATDDGTNNSTTAVLQWSMTRSGYSPIDLSDSVLFYKALDDIDTVVEPYATNALFVVGMDATVYYRYQLCPEDQVGAECFYGVQALNINLVEEVDLKCEPYDVFSVIIKQYSMSTNAELNNYEGRAQCMYVRREVRSLSSLDLTLTMDAMYTLWSTEEEAGQELYGDDFHSASYLLKIHHFNAAWQDADHIHEGNGFLAQHIKMTNIFEKSVQAVDPSVTVPYWDFTIDNEQGKSAFNSIVMTDNLFGSMTVPYNSSWGFSYEDDNITSGAIPDGRWAFLESPMNEDFPDLKAAYGYMRAPWNMNPSPYVSRFLGDYHIGISLPSCAAHYAILEKETLSDFMYDMQNDPHSTTHSLIGGIYGCNLMTPLLESGYLASEEEQKSLCSKWVFYLKEFYRFGYLTPKTDCEVQDDVQSSTCGFECNGDMNALLSNMKTKMADYVPADMSEEGWYAWRDFVCTGDAGKIFSGDHLESASPHDPSFWVIHPTLERLYHAKLMSGGFKDASWPTDPIKDFVCDKSECYDSTTGMLSYSEECCYGHYEDDQMLDFLSGNRTQRFGDTNGAVMKATDPTSDDYSMPYIYDTFTWNHCSDDFSDLFVGLKVEMDAYSESGYALSKEEQEEAESEEDGEGEVTMSASNKEDGKSDDNEDDEDDEDDDTKSKKKKEEGKKSKVVGKDSDSDSDSSSSKSSKKSKSKSKARL